MWIIPEIQRLLVSFQTWLSFNIHSPAAQILHAFCQILVMNYKRGNYFLCFMRSLKLETKTKTWWMHLGPQWLLWALLWRHWANTLFSPDEGNFHPRTVFPPQLYTSLGDPKMQDLYLIKPNINNKNTYIQKNSRWDTAGSGLFSLQILPSSWKLHHSLIIRWQHPNKTDFFKPYIY